MKKFSREKKSGGRDSGRKPSRRDYGKKPGRRDSGRSDRRDSGRRFGGRDYGRRDSGRRRSEPQTMHKVTCDKCGKTCEVPFKPTSSKPIYCDNCFKKNKPSGSKDYSKEFERINNKLDQILEKLGLD